jgi:hypothetical protein
VPDDLLLARIEQVDRESAQAIVLGLHSVRPAQTLSLLHDRGNVHEHVRSQLVENVAAALELAACGGDQAPFDERGVAAGPARKERERAVGMEVDIGVLDARQLGLGGAASQRQGGQAEEQRSTKGIHRSFQ